MSHPSPVDVADALGDKVLNGYANIVARTASDLEAYRAAPPPISTWAAEQTKRGLANWIHDRMAAHALREFDGLSEVTFKTNGPYFEIYSFSADRALTFRTRLKRHTPRGAVRSYPTSGALDFITQPANLLSFAGYSEVNLCVGYEWDDTTHSMLGGVISLHDGAFDEVVWITDLPPVTGAAGVYVPITPMPAGPTPPVIEVASDEDSISEDDATS